MTKLTTRTSTSTRLTDTQLIVLSRAAQREDGAANLPEGITDKAAQKLAATLVRRELVREIRAKPGMPVWRRSEEGRSQALIITKLGRTAIKAEDDRVLEDAYSVVLGAASTDKAAAQLDQARKEVRHAIREVEPRELVKSSKDPNSGPCSGDRPVWLPPARPGRWRTEYCG